MWAKSHCARFARLESADDSAAANGDRVSMLFNAAAQEVDILDTQCGSLPPSQTCGAEEQH